MVAVDVAGDGSCLFHSLLAGEHTPKPHPSDYKPPTPFEKYYLTRRPFVSFYLSALRDLQTRIGHAIDDLPPDHHEMRRRIVEFERAHLDDEIFRVHTLNGSDQSDWSAGQYIRLNGLHNPAGVGRICHSPEEYFTV